jgi:hypothetical protein
LQWYAPISVAFGVADRHIGLVLQEPFCFGTIADNTLYGKPGIARNCCGGPRRPCMNYLAAAAGYDRWSVSEARAQLAGSASAVI